jgi:PAS domain S-box-containing protein
MGGRITRSAQTGGSVRSSRLGQALDGAEPSSLLSAGLPIPPRSAPLDWNALNAGSAAPSSVNANDQQREFLQQLFENSPDALLIVDLSFRIQCVNGEFQRMFGYSAAQALGQTADALILPADRGAESQWMAQCLQRGEAITLETQRHSQGGKVLEIALTMTPLQGAGRVAGYSILLRDVSQRKHAEAVSSALYRIAEKAAAAQDLQQLFAAVHGIVAELMPARNFGIALHDPESQMLTFPYFVDEGAPAPAPARLGHGLVEYVLRSGEPLLCTAERFQGLRVRGEIDGAQPPLPWLGVPLKVNGHAFGAVIVGHHPRNGGLTDGDCEVLARVSRQLSATLHHKRNEQALRRSEVRYRSLVQTAVYGLYRSSLDGQFLDVNPALVGMLGYDSALDVLALDVAKDVFLEGKEYASLVDEFRRTGRMDGFEARWKRRDGATITVRISGRAVASEDQPADVLEAIAEDITERRLLEDQFRQSQKMEAVGRLAGGIAHDFNNLLMVVSGYTEVLLDQLPPGHPLQPKAEAIRQATDRATALTRQLLAFSRKQLLELKVVDFNGIVKGMDRLLRPLIGENIELVTSLDPCTGCTRADAGQLEQVLMNLVVNAKDAMPNGGRISIRTASVTLDDSYRPENVFIQHGPYVMLSVGDTGQGMDRETQARIFEPFFTTKEKGKGTGLGLSTVYGIVKQIGGYIFVQSELHRGTVFNIYLPRVESASAPMDAAPAVVTAGGSETILLVEDEDSVRQLVRETLESRGYRVLEAANGTAALALAARHSAPIHLIITDVIMPGLSGHELIQRLLPARPDAKILFLSGYTEDELTRASTPDGPKAFLQKPFTLQNLSRKVREVLGPPIPRPGLTGSLYGERITPASPPSSAPDYG